LKYVWLGGDTKMKVDKILVGPYELMLGVVPTTTIIMNGKRYSLRIIPDLGTVYTMPY